MHLTKSHIMVFLVLLLSVPSFASAQSVPQLAQKALSATVSLEVQDENNELIAELKRKRGELDRKIAENNREILKYKAEAFLREEEERKHWTDGLAVLFCILVVWYIVSERKAKKKEREFYNEWRRQARASHKTRRENVTD